MDSAAVSSWLDRYVAAWRSYAPEEIGALFAEDAVYRFQPWGDGDDAVHGRDAIVANWLEQPDEPGSWTASYRPYATEGPTAVAVGTTLYHATAEEPEALFHNVFLLRFDESGRCTEFTDVYMRQPD